jgi:glycosyltransferase involved in cell wall biosynthesis
VKIVLFSSAAVSVCLFRLPFVDTLRQRGHQVVVVVGEGSLGECATIERAGVPCHCLGMNRTGVNPLFDAMVLVRLWRLLRSFEYEHLVCYAHKAAIYGLFAHRRGAKCWALLSGLGYAFTGDGPKQRLVRWLFTRIYPRLWHRCDGLFLLNPDDRETLLNQGIIGERQAVCVLRGEGVPVALFPFVVPPLHQGVRFLMIARLLGDKGVREYVEAARVVKTGAHGHSFDFVGPRDSNPAAISDAEFKAWTADGVVNFHGPQEDVRPFLAACNVYVLPSYREGTSRTVLEAMATGRAVITTDAPGCRGTIWGRGDWNESGFCVGENGVLIKPGSVSGLVAAMTYLIENKERCEAMGRAGRALVEQHYDVHKVNWQMLEFMGLAAEPLVNG